MSGQGKRTNTLAADSLAAANFATSSPSGKKRQDSLAAATLSTSSPSTKKKRQDSLATVNLTTSSPSVKKKRQEQDHDNIASTQPSDEVMNALFEQVLVSYMPAPSCVAKLLGGLIEKPKYD